MIFDTTMKKFCLSVLFLFCFFSLSGEKIVLFEKPVQGARFLTIERSLVSGTGTVTRHVSGLPHPLCRILSFHEMQLPRGGVAYHRPDIVVDSNSKVMRRAVFPWERFVFGFFCAVVLIVLLCRRIFYHAAEWELLFIPVLLRMILVVSTVETGVVPVATDEPGYFQTIQDMLNGEWKKQWHFTVGTGFFYLPFILISGAEKFYDIVPAFNYFSALVLAPGILALGFLILRKLGVSAKIACWAMLLWAVYPFVSFHFEDWNVLKFQQFFLIPQWFSQFNGHFYYSFCINAGFNAMSDTPGLLIVMGCVYLVLAMPEKVRYAAIFGALYGFSCLVRINYILLAPCFAYILWLKFQTSPRIFKAAAAACCAFLSVFAIQLICNSLQFGSPLTFGYVLHYTENAAIERPTAGFTWHTFSKWKNLRYLFWVNLPVFASGTAALWVMKDRFKRNVLILLSVPLVLFFCGYSHSFCDARRFVFPAFAGLLMAVFSLDIWQKLSRRDIWQTVLGLGGMILLTVSAAAPWRGVPFAIGEGLVLRLAAWGIPVFLCWILWLLVRKKEYRAALFVFLAAVFFYAPVGILAAGMFLLLPDMLIRQFLPDRWKKFLS